MTTEAETCPPHAEKLQQNLDKIEALSQRLLNVLQSAKPVNAGLHGPEQTLFARAGVEFWQDMVHNPAKVIEQQALYWGRTLQHFIEAQHALSQGKLEAPEDVGPPDRRFEHPLWSSHPYFNFLKQQYFINSETMRRVISEIPDLSQLEQHRLSYFVDQIIDMMAPTNFLATNPQALERAVASEGESLVAGLENLVADLEANNGHLVVKLADEEAFELGRNIATTKGAVVFRNRLLELIQYTPTTPKVRARPIMIFPPWINKFYILDLKAKNSMIKWLVDQGYTVFIVSWINPGPDERDLGIEDYIETGYLEAINVVKDITQQDSINAVGYCIAGTTLGLTLSLLKQRGDTSINSATFFTTLTDFANQGEFTPYLQNDFVDAIEQQIGESGILPSFLMARTFSYLRANDLVYGPAIKSYMLGETPPAFDLLYWNGDGTNLPAKMACQYLRMLCQGNEFANDGFTLFDTRLRISDVTIPICAIACETDHIAPWKDSFRGIAQMGSRSKKFILAESGHIAGIVNPPNKNKYGHYLNAMTKAEPDSWKENARYHQGSWWPEWESWLRKKSGQLVSTPELGGANFQSLAEAPGTYVTVKAPTI